MEVASSNDRPAEIQRKATMWLDAGVRQVWVALPTERVIESPPRGPACRHTRRSRHLDGADVVQAFQHQWRRSSASALNARPPRPHPRQPAVISRWLSEPRDEIARRWQEGDESGGTKRSHDEQHASTVDC